MLLTIVVLVLVIAVGLSFAMISELSRRLAEGDRNGSVGEARYVRPLGREGVYLRPDVSWPKGLEHVDHSSVPSLVLVLSTSCMSCTKIAQQLTTGRIDMGSGSFGIVISTADEHRAVDFVAKNGLQDLPYYIDEGGDWTEASLGLSLSPVGLVLGVGGELREIYVFNDFDSLWSVYKEDEAWKKAAPVGATTPASYGKAAVEAS